jgi:hypothetical protein
VKRKKPKLGRPLLGETKMRPRQIMAPDELWEAVAVAALEDGVSISAFVREAIERRL